MKRLLIAIVLLASSAFGQAAYTATTTGNWSNSSNYTHTGTPCYVAGAYPVYNGDPNSSSTACGDTLTINTGVTLTCDLAVCTVGNSPTTNAAVVTGNGTAGITVAAGKKLIYAGRVQLTSGATTLGAGSTLQYDSSYASSNATTVRYTWDCTASACSANAPTWAVNGTSGSHAVIDGDSFDSPYNKTATCAAANTCQAGAFNFPGGASFSTANQGTGTISYLDIKNVYGTAINSIGNAAWVTAVKSNASAFDHITNTNSGTLSFNEVSGATAGLTVNGLAVTNSSYTGLSSTGNNPGAEGCMKVSENSTTSATFSISNAYIDCVVDMPSTNANYGVFTFRNMEMYRSPSGAFPGIHSGIGNGAGISPADVFDEYMMWPSVYFTGAGTDSIRPDLPIFAMVNSVIWSPKVSTSGAHLQLYGSSMDQLPASGNSAIKNNVFGATGSSVASPSAQVTTSMSFVMSLLSRAVNLTVSGNVALCDQWGYSSLPILTDRITSAIPFAVTINSINNVRCTAVIGGFSSTTDIGGNEGTFGYEIAAATVANLTQTVNSNLFWNLKNIAVPEVCGSDSTQIGTGNPQSMTLQHNAVFNGTTTSGTPQICNDGNAGNSSTWPLSGPANDIVTPNRVPVMVDGRRSPITFDCDYLAPAGYLSGSPTTCASYWPTQTGWIGAWAASTSYATGAIVSDSQAGVWGGKTTYWRCINLTNCNSGSTSPNITRPSTGIDPSNYMSDYVQFWEPAYMQYFRAQVYAGTVFYEGAVPQLTDISGNPEPMHMVGLLNAWIRQGMVDMEPTLWRGCLSGAECGPSYAAIQHIPPPVMMN